MSNKSARGNRTASANTQVRGASARGNGAGRPNRSSRAREQAARMRAEQLRAARRKRNAWVAAIVVAVLVAAGGIGFAVYQSSRPPTSNVATPAHNVASGGIQFGKASAPATLELYEDFQCPVCRAFEAQSGSTIDQLAAQGKVKVVFHPLQFLNRESSGTRYSTRSSAASGCAADAGAGVFEKYVAVLFNKQPPEGGTGLTNDKLVQLGRKAGATSNTFAQCVKSQKYAKWTAALTTKAEKRGVNATPTVFLNGKQLQDLSPNGIKSAVAQAGSSKK